MTLERLTAQWDEIASVQERVKIKILRGTESDILADGALDYPDPVLEQFDVVIASIHARLGLGRREMTERLVRAMRSPIFKIWGHALGRLLLEREPFDCDVEAVLDALAGQRGAVEINGDPLDWICRPEWIPRARERGIPFVVSVDAHSTAGLEVLPYAVMMARRGGLTRGEVLNTQGARAFMALVPQKWGQDRERRRRQRKTSSARRERAGKRRAEDKSFELKSAPAPAGSDGPRARPC